MRLFLEVLKLFIAGEMSCAFRLKGSVFFPHCWDWCDPGKLSKKCSCFRFNKFILKYKEKWEGPEIVA